MTVNEHRLDSAAIPLSARDDTRVGRFVQLSVDLTGFSQFELLGTGLAETYLSTLEAVLPDGLPDELLGAVTGSGPQAERILADPKLGPLARNVILMWMCGTWTALPDVWRATYGISALDTDRVISAQTYQGGLQWVAAGAHPAGARQQGFGAWALPPATSPPVPSQRATPENHG
jgi:hypothetical protein